MLRLKQNYKQNLATQMMTPIQRVTRSVYSQPYYIKQLN